MAQDRSRRRPAEAAAPALPAKRLNPIKLRQLRERPGSMEEEIADFKSAEESMRLAALIEERRKSLAALLSEWEEVSAQIETGA